MTGVTSVRPTFPRASAESRTALAAEITRAASRQTYYTIRFLVDRERVADAYRAYAYFRWLDDRLDDGLLPDSERLALLRRQQALLEAGYRGEMPADLSDEEQMLADLIRGDSEKQSGLQSYLRNMMAVMAFDVARRGRAISHAELAEYSRLLATSVTEALLHFVGHDDPAPGGESRYLAVRGAHVMHMLRDTVEDTEAGYYNVPAEYLAARGLSVRDIAAPAYRELVGQRVRLAERYFQAGRAFMARLRNPRRRLAGYAYIARFEWMARAIARDGYRLRAEYSERKSPGAALWMAGRVLSSTLSRRRPVIETRAPAIQS